jgi:hypothetical protein
MDEPGKRIALVGPCASGKSALGRRLRALGYNVREPAQEHSFVPDMWQRLTDPDILIYLDVDHPNTVARRHVDWPEKLWREQQHRLRHAREGCDFLLDTVGLDEEEVFQRVLAFLLVDS